MYTTIACRRHSHWFERLLTSSMSVPQIVFIKLRILSFTSASTLLRLFSRHFRINASVKIHDKMVTSTCFGAWQSIYEKEEETNIIINNDRNNNALAYAHDNV